MSQNNDNKSSDRKDVVIRCRVTKEFDKALEKYCNEHNTTKTVVMIEGIKKIINE